MTFPRLTEVELKTNSKVRGKVLGVAKRLDGRVLCIVQVNDIVYAAPEALWKSCSCNHDKDFYLHVERGKSVWACVHMCGFHLNFDPGKFPDGIALVEGRVGRAVSYVASKF